MTKVAAAIIRSCGKILICRRSEKGDCPLLWEFPGGKIETGESAEQCAVRECREELNIEIKITGVYAETSYSYPERDICFTFLNAEIVSGTIQKNVHADVQWVKPDVLNQYEFCPADKEVVKRLQAEKSVLPFQDKICVITGGALGIGRCLTREFAKAGAKVSFVDMNKEAGNENLAQIRNFGGTVSFFCGDIANETVLQEFTEHVVAELGGIDFLINNACLSKRGILSGCSYEDFNYVLRIGVSAPYQLTQLFLPHFRKGASVVNISSSRAFMSQADTESYTAAKGGITALTHALAVSLAGKVRVNSIAPGWIDTGAYHDDDYIPQYSKADEVQHPSGRVGTSIDIARAVFFLCDERNDFINGENITIDGGMTKLMIYHGDEGWAYTPK